MKTKHTPGPWTVENGKRARGYMTAVMRDGFAIADVPCLRGDPYDDDEADANAHLIAAAPDLLAALQETLRALECHLDDDTKSHGLKSRDCLCPCNSNEVVRARAALSRATGGAS